MGAEMPESDASKHMTSERATAHRRMLEEALARPGVREVMEVYGAWQEKDRALDTWREAVRLSRRGTVTTAPTSH